MGVPDISYPSIFRAMRHGPLPSMLDWRARWQRSSKTLDGWQRLHRLPPAAEARVLRIHGFTLFRQAEGKSARHEIEVRKREISAQDVRLPVRQLPLQDLEAH